MNTIRTAVGQRLEALPPELRAIKLACLRHISKCCGMDRNDSAMIGHTPWNGMLSYLIVLFPPAKRSWFSKYEKLHGIKIPAKVRSILSSVNGCSVFGIELFGMPLSMLRDPPLLDRTALQCLDIAEANRHWRHGYDGDNPGYHIGGREYSDNENIGYFLQNDQSIEAVRKSGEVIGKWKELAEFLDEEVSVAEARALAAIPEAWW